MGGIIPLCRGAVSIFYNPSRKVGIEVTTVSIVVDTPSRYPTFLVVHIPCISTTKKDIKLDQTSLHYGSLWSIFILHYPVLFILHHHEAFLYSTTLKPFYTPPPLAAQDLLREYYIDLIKDLIVVCICMKISNFINNKLSSIYVFIFTWILLNGFFYSSK